MYRLINKYGFVVNQPGMSGTKPEKKIEEILLCLGCRFQMGFAFDEKGLRRKKFDAAVFRDDGSVAFLIEYDGSEHYDPDFFRSMGNRVCRNIAHVVKEHLADAEKCRIAAEKNIPLLRVNVLYDAFLRNVILAWVWTFVDGETDPSPEVNMIRMMDTYGWSFDYFCPSCMTNRETEYLCAHPERRIASVDGSTGGILFSV